MPKSQVNTEFKRRRKLKRIAEAMESGTWQLINHDEQEPAEVYVWTVFGWSLTRKLQQNN